MTKLLVLVVDDHGVVREGLKLLINAQPGLEVVGEAADGGAAVEAARVLKPHVVLIDITMPGLDGARATELLKQICPSIKILALTAHEDKGYLHQLLKAGASGYVLKRAAAEELIRAIRIVTAGGIYVDPTLAGKVLASAAQKQGSTHAPTGSDLSDREEQVIRLIAEGYSNKEIAARLALSVKTIETHKARSMEKLGLCGRTELVRYALQRGWLQSFSSR